jgi:pterin-4a-carbinolamine dehydratase
MSEELNDEKTLEPAVQEVQAEANPVESVEEKSETVAPATTREEVIARLQEMVGDISLAKRPELESLKQVFYKLQRAAEEERIAAFVAGGGTAEEFKPEPDPVEDQFRKLMNIIKEKKAAAQEALEVVRKENYKKKLEILDRFKALIEKANTEGASYNEFKAILQEWKEIKEVPADKANELWKAYQQYAEQFYDIQKLNNEFREYDFKKNMEAKIAICEEAEKLADEPDIVAAFRKLQKLHQDYRETGPVSKESREEIWNRFKTASTVINKRHQQHFEELKDKEKENLDQKTVICELLEAIEYDKLTTFQSWNDKTQEVLALQKKWKDIGFAPAKQNQKIFERFRAACDQFFSRKGEFFKQAKTDMTANLEKKTALCEQAEALKDSTDWKATGDKMAELQKQWREIGPVQKKYTNSIWKRFIGACDYFYEQRDKNTSSKKHEENANLAAKKEILAKLKAFDAANLSDDDIQTIQQLVDEWNGIGFVPFKMKDKIAADFKAVMEPFGSVVRTGRGRQSQRGGSPRESGSPREKLQRQYEQKKSEIQTYENNLGFMNASSKSGNGFVDAIKSKIDELKKEADEILAQIKALDSEEIEN